MPGQHPPRPSTGHLNEFGITILKSASEESPIRRNGNSVLNKPPLSESGERTNGVWQYPLPGVRVEHDPLIGISEKHHRSIVQREGSELNNKRSIGPSCRQTLAGLRVHSVGRICRNEDCRTIGGKARFACFMHKLRRTSNAPGRGVGTEPFLSTRPVPD